MQRDSLLGTFTVALVLCLVCATLVSSTAVFLRPWQQYNQERFRKSKVLEVAGVSAEEIQQAGGVLEAFDRRIQGRIIYLETGEDAVEALEQALAEFGKDVGGDVLGKYDQFWAAKQKRDLLGREITDRSQDPVGIKWVEKFSHVYMVKAKDDPSQIEMYIFPIRGNGLWGIMQGFISLKPDFRTVNGLTFFDHKETPGLGGEVDNEDWKAQWPEQILFNESGEIVLTVKKGKANQDSPYEIDGLSGATITSNAVNSMLEFWFGQKGFQAFIENERASATAAVSAENSTDNQHIIGASMGDSSIQKNLVSNRGRE